MTVKLEWKRAWPIILCFFQTPWAEPTSFGIFYDPIGVWYYACEVTYKRCVLQQFICTGSFVCWSLLPHPHCWGEEDHELLLAHVNDDFLRHGHTCVNATSLNNSNTHTGNAVVAVICVLVFSLGAREHCGRQTQRAQVPSCALVFIVWFRNSSAMAANCAYCSNTIHSSSQKTDVRLDDSNSVK